MDSTGPVRHSTRPPPPFFASIASNCPVGIEWPPMINNLGQPVALPPLELHHLFELKRLLESDSVQLTADSGDILDVPSGLHQLLKQVVEQMLEGRASR